MLRISRLLVESVMVTSPTENIMTSGRVLERPLLPRKGYGKYRISLNSHRVPNAETVAWGMTAAACIKIARCIYANSLLVCIDEYGVPKQLLDSIFGQLDLSAVDKKWDEALILLEPFTETYDLSESEQKNIQLGIDQLHEELTSMATLTDTLTDSIGSYGEVFRTQGEQKKALRKLAELRG